jgi:hypothetical protein
LNGAFLRLISDELLQLGFILGGEVCYIWEVEVHYCGDGGRMGKVLGGLLLVIDGLVVH